MSLHASMSKALSAELRPMNNSHKMLANCYKYFSCNTVGKQGFAILLTTGSLNPIHTGHVDMMNYAKEELEGLNYNVVGGFMSPSHDNYVQTKPNYIRSHHRLEMIKLAVSASDWIVCDEWECKQNRFIDYPQVCQQFSKEIVKNLPSLISKYCIEQQSQSSDKNKDSGDNVVDSITNNTKDKSEEKEDLAGKIDFGFTQYLLKEYCLSMHFNDFKKQSITVAKLRKMTKEELEGIKLSLTKFKRKNFDRMMKEIENDEIHLKKIENFNREIESARDNVKINASYHSLNATTINDNRDEEKETQCDDSNVSNDSNDSHDSSYSKSKSEMWKTLPNISLFYVCGRDHADKCHLWKGVHTYGGQLVAKTLIVPRPDDKHKNKKASKRKLKHNNANCIVVNMPQQKMLDDRSSTIVRNIILKSKGDVKMFDKTSLVKGNIINQRVLQYIETNLEQLHKQLIDKSFKF